MCFYRTRRFAINTMIEQFRNTTHLLFSIVFFIFVICFKWYNNEISLLHRNKLWLPLTVAYSGRKDQVNTTILICFVNRIDTNRIKLHIEFWFCHVFMIWRMLYTSFSINGNAFNLVTQINALNIKE